MTIPVLLLISSCDRSADPEPETPKLTPPSVSNNSIMVHDSDGDGELSVQEKAVMNEKFVKHFDQDGDGILSNREKAKARVNSKVTVKSSANRAIKSLDEAERFLARYDSDEDRNITEAEAGANRWKVMKKADRNQDGMITAQEWLDRIPVNQR